MQLLLITPLLLALLHLLPAVVNDGLDAVSICEQECVPLSRAHVPHSDPFWQLDEESRCWKTPTYTIDVHEREKSGGLLTLARRGTVLGDSMCPSWPELLLPHENTWKV